MSRTARLLALAALGCLTVGTAPAFAQATDTTKVTYAVPDGTRQFEVTEVDGTTQLQDFVFGPTRQKPFRTIVKDVNRSLLSSGYQVNAKMTNLYRVDGTGYDYTEVVPSKNLSLTYGASPLAGTSTLPLVPRVSLSGTVGDCSSPAVATALGLTAPLTSLLGSAFTSLSTTLQTVCTELAGLTSAQRTVAATVDGAVKSVTAPLSLSDLPFTLTGGEGGRFTNPSFDGAIASADPAKNATVATSKRIMTGTSLLKVGDPTPLLAALNTALAAALPPTLITSDNSGVATLASAVAAISAGNAPLASTLSRLPVADQLDLVNLLTRTLQTVDVSALTTVTSQYDAYPVLQIDQFAGKQGNYDGNLIVDFFETGT